MPHTTPSTAARASCSRDTSLRRPASTPVAVGRSGVRSPSKYGSSASPPAPGAADERQAIELVVVDTHQAAHGIDHLCGVQRAHQRQEPAGGIGEAGHRARGVGARLLGDRERGARRAERHHRVTGVQAEAQCGGHVVAGADGDAGALPLPDHLERIGHPRHDARPVAVAVDDREHVPPVLARCRRPVPRARRIAAIGDQRCVGPAQLRGEPVVRQHDVREARPLLGLATGAATTAWSTSSTPPARCRRQRPSRRDHRAAA